MNMRWLAVFSFAAFPAFAGAGAYYAVKTLGQLARRENGRTVVPAVSVSDAPAYAWRAMSLDEGRMRFRYAIIQSCNR